MEVPCQSFSFSGKQEGGDVGSGTRSSLMYETIRIIKKVLPKYVLWENVENVTKGKHKYNFSTYLDTMEKLGYTNYYKVLDAQDYGIPQQRNRLFVLSIKTETDDFQFTFPLKQILTKTFRDYLQDDYDVKRMVLNPKEFELINRYNNKQNKDTRPGDLDIDNNIIVHPTILAGLGKVSGRGLVFKCREGWRKITPLEAWRLMRF